MATYALEVRPGSAGYVFATREDGQLFEVYLQYASIEPRIEDAAERAVLVAAARAYRAPAAPASAPRDRSRDIPDVRAQMSKAGFYEDENDIRGLE